MKTYLAVNKNGDECIFKDEPYKVFNEWYPNDNGSYIELPKGSILKLIGKELTWNNEPYLFE